MIATLACIAAKPLRILLSGLAVSALAAAWTPVLAADSGSDSAPSLPMNVAPLGSDADTPAGHPATSTPTPTPAKGPHAAEDAGKNGLTPAAPAGPAKTGQLVGEWTNGQQQGKDGVVSYCFSRAHFDSNLQVMIARNLGGETDLEVLIPQGHLPSDRLLPIKVRIDNGKTREPRARALAPEQLVITLGHDDEFYQSLLKGKQLSIESPGDKAVFSLAKSAKALGELKSCTDRAIAKGGSDAVARAAMPEPLRGLLAAAGIREFFAVDLSAMKPDDRPADFMWKVGQVLGGVREFPVEDETNMKELLTDHSDALKKQCKGDFKFEQGKEETLPTVTLETASFTCANPDKAVYASLVFRLTNKGRMFDVFFHQTDPEHKAEADRLRDGIAGVLRKASAKPPAGADTDAAPQTSEAPVTPATPADATAK